MREKIFDGEEEVVDGRKKPSLLPQSKASQSRDYAAILSNVACQNLVSV